MIRDGDRQLPALVGDADQELAVLATVTNRILDQIADRLGNQLAMTEEFDRLAWPVKAQDASGFLGHRLVHFAEFRPELANLEPGELAAAGERFGAADFER